MERFSGFGGDFVFNFTSLKLCEIDNRISGILLY